LLLQQLQAAAKSRISSEDQKFTSQYELGAFLQNHIPQATTKMGRLDILFEVMKATNLDYPRVLNPALENWDKGNIPDSSVALSLMDHIFFDFQHGQENRRRRESKRQQGIASR